LRGQTLKPAKDKMCGLACRQGREDEAARAAMAHIADVLR
jgi:hypothetical protein